MQNEFSMREVLVDVCRGVYDRELVSSSGGNISVRLDDSFLITPTGLSLGRLTADQLVQVGLDGSILSAGKPSKEVALHLGAYKSRSDIGAVVHVHSTYAVCLSCMLAKESFPVPIMSPGYAIRVGRLPVIPFFVPGSPELAEGVNNIIKTRDSVLLSKHGVVVVGKDLQSAINLVEEIEENAKIFILGGTKAVGLSDEEFEAVINKYRK